MVVAFRDLRDEDVLLFPIVGPQGECIVLREQPRQEQGSRQERA